jgi:hypothetical protein
VLVRLTRLAEALGVNSLPVVGLFAGDWSWSTALGVYWFENLIAATLIGLRLMLHRRWRAAIDEPRPDGLTAPRQFFVTTLAFNVVHGVFLAAVLLIVVKVAPDLASLRQAALALLAMQGLAFGLDLWTLDQWPVGRMDERANHLLGRVVLVHLSLLVGLITYAVFDKEWAFFACFAGLKGLSDLSQFLPASWRGAVPTRPATSISR